MTRREKIFWLVIGAVFVIGFVFLIPACNQGDEQHNDPQQQQCPGNKVAFLTIRHAAEFIDAHNWILTALFAGLVTLFTWRLWQATNELRGSTDRLWKAGDEQLEFARESAIEQAANMEASLAISDKAAAAAERSAKVAEGALFVAQRPYIFVTAVNFKHPPVRETFDYTGPEIWPWIYFHLENHGSSPASIIEVCADSACVRELPTVPQYRENTTYDSPRLLGAGKEETVGYVFKTPIDGQVMNDIAIPHFMAENARRLFAFGYIKYKDIFEYTHTLGFCWRYNLDLKTFIPALEEEGYTYRKAEPPKLT